MARKRVKTIPQRTRTKDLQRANYYKTLGTRPISGTTQNFPSDAELHEQATLGGTEYIPEEDTAKTELEFKEKTTEKKSFLKEHIEIIGGVIIVIIFIAGIVTAYNNLTNKTDNLKTELTDYKKENGDAIRKIEKDLKEDMGRITERIDKYVSKKP